MHRLAAAQLHMLMQAVAEQDRLAVTARQQWAALAAQVLRRLLQELPLLAAEAAAVIRQTEWAIIMGPPRLAVVLLLATARKTLGAAQEEVLLAAPA